MLIKYSFDQENKCLEMHFPEPLQNKDIVRYYVFKALRNNLRNSHARVKRRGDVSGGGKKPWKQKGTGRARQGSIRAPQWRKGGVVFGPNNRDYTEKINKKLLCSAVVSMFSDLFESGRIQILSSLKCPRMQTRLAKDLIGEERINCFFSSGDNKEIMLSFRNLPNAKIFSASPLNLVPFFQSSKCFFTLETMLRLLDVYNVRYILS